MRNFCEKSLTCTVFISEALETFPLKSRMRQGFLLLLLLFISLKVLVKVVREKKKDETRVGKKLCYCLWSYCQEKLQSNSNLKDCSQVSEIEINIQKSIAAV